MRLPIHRLLLILATLLLVGSPKHNGGTSKIMAEYLAHKDEYPSFEAFSAARVRKSPWARRMLARFARPKRNPAP